MGLDEFGRRMHVCEVVSFLLQTTICVQRAALANACAGYRSFGGEAHQQGSWRVYTDTWRRT
jgi:hypothetical protein